MNNIFWWWLCITKWANGVLALGSVAWESCLSPCCSSSLFEPALHGDMSACMFFVRLQYSVDGSGSSILSALAVKTQHTCPVTHVQHFTCMRGLAAFVDACVNLCIFLSGSLYWVLCCACECECVLKSLRTWQLMEVYSTALKKPTGCSLLIN